MVGRIFDPMHEDAQEGTVFGNERFRVRFVEFAAGRRIRHPQRAGAWRDEAETPTSLRGAAPSKSSKSGDEASVGWRGPAREELLRTRLGLARIRKSASTIHPARRVIFA